MSEHFCVRHLRYFKYICEVAQLVKDKKVKNFLNEEGGGSETREYKQYKTVPLNQN